LSAAWGEETANEQMAAQLAGETNRCGMRLALERIAARLQAIEHRFIDCHPVTALPMREHLFEVIQRDIAAGASPCRLGLLRFAGFDRLAGFDQAAADAALGALAARLRAAARAEHVIAQVDRDCFAIWLRGASADALIGEFRALAFVAGQELDSGGASLDPAIETGLAAFPEDGITAISLLARATATSGVVGESVSSTASLSDGRERFLIERDLPYAIDAGQLAMVFQPVVDLSAGRLIGAEALLRWTHPDLGPISPARFIPIMEAMGLSESYGLWVLNAAAREARAWCEAGNDPIRMAVNLSARQLVDPLLVAKIMRTIERHRLDPGMIELELTESAAMEDADRTARVFAELRATGIRLAIDDFGTGYSSLSYLKRLSFDKLKIDREFVTDIQHRRDSRAICRALVELGRGLDLIVLAEGVECEEEVAALRALGCHIFQGFHFARPMTGEAFRALARDTAWLARLASPVHRQLGHLEGRLSA
jgi:Amt family ammonium transporter